MVPSFRFRATEVLKCQPSRTQLLVLPSILSASRGSLPLPASIRSAPASY